MKGVAMGQKAADALAITQEELPNYLHAQHSVYMDVDGKSYYLSDVNDIYWRVQDTAKKNDKGHYVDCSELVPTLSEFLDLPFKDGKSVNDLFPEATFYASENPERVTSES